MFSTKKLIITKKLSAGKSFLETVLSNPDRKTSPPSLKRTSMEKDERKKESSIIEENDHIDEEWEDGLNHETTKSKKMNFKKTTKQPKKSCYIFVDASFYIFYRYCATKVWFVKHTKMGEDKDCHVDNPLFLDKYVKHFQDGIKKIMKKFHPDGIIYFRDSPKQTVWRMEFLKSYKERRDQPSEPFISQFFRYSFEHLIPNDQVISVAQAEGDDVIAIATKYENQHHPNREIMIITGDSDFLQLVNQQTKVIRLPKLDEMPVIVKINGDKIEVDGPTYIHHKVLIGDKSDDIPKVYHGCGPKMAYDMVLNQELLQQHILDHPDRKTTYELNKKLIMFDEIPQKIKDQIIQNYKRTVYKE